VIGREPTPAAFLVESSIDLTGELVQVNRPSFGSNSVINHLNRGHIIESKPCFENAIKPLPVEVVPRHHHVAFGRADARKMSLASNATVLPNINLPDMRCSGLRD
jgi:hypothetical protein